MKKFGISLLLLISLLPLKGFAQASTAGFVPGSIWYSIDPFEEGDKVQIYTVIFNPDNRELDGTVVFFDNSTLLGTKNFAANGKSVKDVYINWTVTAGDHKIFAKIENAKFLISAGKYEEVYLAENETPKSSREVSKKIVPITASASTSTNSTTDSTIKNIENTILNKTPDTVSKPILSAATAVEDFRAISAVSTENKKTEIGNQIKVLNSGKASSNSKIQTASKFLKPFKYAELFFFTLFSFIFNNKIVFYGVSLILIFFVLRFFFRLIF
jgi:hypothetical protein